MNLENFKSILSSKGYKVTKQREIVFKILLDNIDSHLSPEELHEIIVKQSNDIGIATVYRTLLLFEDIGIVYKLSFEDNKFRYELISEEEKHHHHHLICTKCYKIQELKFDLLENMEEDIEKKYNFKIKDHSLKFFGLCSSCQSIETGQGDLKSNEKTK